MFVNDEIQLVDLAIEMEQKGDRRSRARARAIRGAMMPLRTFIESEAKIHWPKDKEEVAETLMATCRIFGSILASLAFSTTQIRDREARLKVLQLIASDVMNAALQEEATATGMLEKGIEPWG